MSGDSPKVRRIRQRFCALCGSLLVCLPATHVCAEETDVPDSDVSPVFQADYGGVGLLETPTARMAPVGTFSFTYSEVDPYTHYGFSFQPFEWMEAGFRYTQIGNRLYGRSIAGDRDYLDKGVDVKFSLLDERTYTPEVSLGFRDFGGTGLFSSEYLVANKRWYDFDFSLGLGWGYLGSRGDLGNPIGVFSERYKERIDEDTGQGGDFNLKQLFSGRTSVFGGIQYHTPFEPLTLQIEYEGNDYESEPLNNPQEQDSPINVGARLQVNDNLTLSAAWERGNTAMLGATLSVNLATIMQPKSDPPPVAVGKPGAAREQGQGWDEAAKQLSANAGIATRRISRDGKSLVVEGSPNRYRNTAEAELRANRILHNFADADIEQFRYRWVERGIVSREDVLPREPLPADPFIVNPGSVFSDQDYRYGVASVASSSKRAQRETEQPLYDDFGKVFSWRFSPGFRQNYGGPDGYLYQVLAKLDTQLKTDDHGWFSGTLGYTLLDNFDQFDYIADSDLPRVRTFIAQYLDETELGIYNLQYTRTARLADNWFGMAYAGYLEQMYAGAGGEIMYRPFNSRVALGFDANWVRQRDFDTQFGLRDYETWVGNATAYIDTGFKDVLAKVSVGRYLAEDIGTTIDFSREFESGVRLGAFATFTDAGDDYGEGGFDKGIYLSMPLDLFFNKSSRGYAAVGWQPLTRDGGAQLARRYSLYGLTDMRAIDDYWENYEDVKR
ncbi:YjbH domain-containing protein [Salinisphaera sp.]|uniref:YjbH domain-containing protein n=1 Tax=Salinisphaera sp. TaxID=1914330 RepID=UPI000C658E75|nr:YjbH domain-containing protein [Salinisphaera sp.]MBS62470.1 hypothetical protein [Salinisphaera sp.]